MNERFLFRGKRLDNGEWIEGFYLSDKREDKHYIAPKFLITKGDIKMNGEMPPSVIYYLVDPATVGQCTGLHAAKSYRGDNEDARLIFEGDIVKVVWDSDPEYGLTDDENSELYAINDIRYIPKIKGSSIKYCEIIGNIHDNKDLLNA